jgi:hypothetical protein
MTSDGALSVTPPARAAFESGSFPVEVIVTWQSEGGWHVASVLVRSSGCNPVRQPPWTEPFWDDADVSAEWEYLAERVRSGQGGNIYSYELSGFEVADVEHVAPIVNAFAAEAVAATYGPMGEVAGTILFDQPAGEGTVVMPVVLLRDDRGDDALVLTGTNTEASVRISTGPEVTPRRFQSVEHWQRAGATSWPVTPGSSYTVSWNDNHVDVRVGLDGHFTIEAGGNDDRQIQELSVAFGPGGLHEGDMRIERVGVPRWVTESDYDDEKMSLLFGDDLPWSFAIPWVHRALASPLTHEPMLAAPRPGDDFAGAFGYWSSLLHLLVYSFGWSRPDRGLRWWYDAGQPIEDERLSLVSRVWGNDGHLDLLAAQLWTRPSDFLVELTDYRSGDESVPIDERWLDQVREQAAAFDGPKPFTGDPDPLHLPGHLAGPINALHGEAILLTSEAKQRRGVLLVDSPSGWYRALVEQGATLPDVGERSWRVDVVVRSVGWLGAYRRSRVTNLWFAGKHRYHVVGN